MQHARACLIARAAKLEHMRKHATWNVRAMRDMHEAHTKELNNAPSTTPTINTHATHEQPYEQKRHSTRTHT